jgi:hypothetical protein
MEIVSHTADEIFNLKDNIIQRGKENEVCEKNLQLFIDANTPEDFVEVVIQNIYWLAENKMLEEPIKLSDDQLLGGIIHVGDEETAVSGEEGISVSGYKGNSISGDYGKSVCEDRGISISGHKGTSISGYSGTSISRDEGISISKDWGNSVSGILGNSTSGDYGTSISEDFGTSISKKYGKSKSGFQGKCASGIYGFIQIEYHEEGRTKVKTGYIGKDGLESDVLYKLDSSHNFVKVEEEMISD